MGTQKQAYVLLVSLLLLSGCLSASQLLTKEEKDFKKYAISICLGSSFPEDSIRTDANTSANAYMGNIDLKAYDDLRSVLENWDLASFQSKQGNAVRITRCLEFSDSKQVKIIFDNYNPCLDSKSWLSMSEFKKQCRHVKN